MSKVAVLGDTHFAARNASPIFARYFAKFYVDVFIPYLVANDIKIVFQLGDLFDVRKFINIFALAGSKEYFFDLLAKHQIHMYSLLGNHDIFFRESLEVNSPELLLAEYHNITIVKEPRVVTVEGTDFHIVPWICRENEKAVLQDMRATKADILMGHFEISGFSMYRGVQSHGGLDTKLFEKYEQVWSGHYHTRSQNGNITYVGTPYELTWQDCGDPRGFHVFDLSSRTLEFVQNPYTIHARIEYDDSKGGDVSLPDVKDKFVRVVVINKRDLYKFDQFIQRIQTAGALDVKIIEDLAAEFKTGELDDSIDLEDTLTVVTNYVDSVETDSDKAKVKDYMKTLYIEALNIEE